MAWLDGGRTECTLSERGNLLNRYHDASRGLAVLSLFYYMRRRRDFFLFLVCRSPRGHLAFLATRANHIRILRHPQRDILPKVPMDAQSISLQLGNGPSNLASALYSESGLGTLIPSRPTAALKDAVIRNRCCVTMGRPPFLIGDQ